MRKLFRGSSTAGREAPPSSQSSLEDQEKLCRQALRKALGERLYADFLKKSEPVFAIEDKDHPLAELAALMWYKDRGPRGDDIDLPLKEIVTGTPALYETVCGIREAFERLTKYLCRQSDQQPSTEQEAFSCTTKPLGEPLPIEKIKQDISTVQEAPPWTYREAFNCRYMLQFSEVVIKAERCIAEATAIGNAIIGYRKLTEEGIADWLTSSPRAIELYLKQAETNGGLYHHGCLVGRWLAGKYEVASIKAKIIELYESTLSGQFGQVGRPVTGSFRNFVYKQ
jgi:hypothetical protein